MSPERRPPLAIALVHHPVRNRLGEVIAATVDEFDYFDASRVCLTYGVGWLYMAQPVEAQQAKAHRLIRYGADAERAGGDRAAFTTASVVPDLASAVAAERARLAELGIDEAPLVVGTTARRWPEAQPMASIRDRLHADRPVLLVLGKAWGFPDDFLEGLDTVMAPIEGGLVYNHLSVRSAFAILVDRLMG